MRVLLRGGCSFLLAASLLIVGTAPRADELLVMPYSCSFSGGKAVLIPSEDKGYRIIGGREQPSVALVARDEASAPISQRRPPAPQPVPARIPDLASNWGDTIPQTRVDALRVLGIGVSSDANQAAIKKIVDGLRMSWHPDHSDGEDDRSIRDLRLKQINAAWELISGTRAEEHA